MKSDNVNFKVPEQKLLYDMTELDIQNQQIPEEVSCIAKEIFDSYIKNDVFQFFISFFISEFTCQNQAT